MDRDEGDALLDRLYAHCDQPRFRYSHRRRPGDVPIRDNPERDHRFQGYFTLAARR